MRISKVFVCKSVVFAVFFIVSNELIQMYILLCMCLKLYY